MEMHTATELLQAYARGERRFSYWALAGADLRGADLRDSNFYGSDLSGSNLSGADLTRANLGKADLYNANLTGANLSGAFYQDANLTRADMSGIVTNNPSPALSTSQPAASQTGVVSWGPPAPAGAVDAAVIAQAPQVCAQCGAQLPADALFCSRCGRPTGAVPSAAESPVTLPPPAIPPVSTPPSYPAPAPTANVRYAYPTATPSSSAPPQRPTPTAQRAPTNQTTNNKVVTGLAVTAFAISSVWDFIYKAAIVIVVIVGIVYFLRGCAANATLNEHSSCGQFEQADSSTQDQVLQQMMTAHHDQVGSFELTRASLTLYCDVYGSNAPIDGIYGSGGSGGSIAPRQVLLPASPRAARSASSHQ